MTLITNKPLFLTLIILLIATWAVFVHFGTSQVGCKNFNPEQKVNLNLVFHEPKLNKDLNQNQIENKYIRAGYNIAPYNHKNLPSHKTVPAIVITDITYEPKIKPTSSIRGLKGKTCFAINEIDLSLNINQTLYINHKSYDFKCEFNAALGHETKHLQMNRDYIEKYANIFEDELLQAIKHNTKKYKTGPFKTSQTRRIKRKFKKRMEASLKTATLKTQNNIKEIRTLVDTAEEYERVDELCYWQ